jgi:Phage tail lysozyme
MAAPTTPGRFVGEHNAGYFWNGTSWDQAETVAGTTPAPAAPAAAPAAPSGGSGASDFTKRAYDFFIQQGWAPHQAAVLASNANWESGGRTRVEHDSGTGVGIYGFRDPQPGVGRKTDLFNFAKANNLDPYAEETQLKFAQHELTGSEKAAGDKLKASTDLKGAQDAVMAYLRPSGYTPDNPGGGHGYAQRLAAAGGVTGDGATAPTPTAGLLMPSTPIDMTAAAAAVEKAKQEKEQEQAFADLTKTGTGLLGQAQPKPLQFASAPIDIHAPQPNPPPLPNYRAQAEPGDDEFMKMLMQQRLQRRV